VIKYEKLWDYARLHTPDGVYHDPSIDQSPLLILPVVIFAFGFINSCNIIEEGG
jgi:hypothetical protein